MKLYYTSARRAHIKGPYIFSGVKDGKSISVMIPLKSSAEVPEDIANLILSKDGDIISRTKNPKKKMVETKPEDEVKDETKDVKSYSNKDVPI